MPTRVVAKIPIRIAPLILRTIRIIMSTSPMQATCTSWSEKLPSPTNVAELATTSLALRRPTKAMNMPIPAAVEYFRQLGMPFTICSRMRVTVKIRKNTPEKKITPNAVCHAMCMPRQMEYVK